MKTTLVSISACWLLFVGSIVFADNATKSAVLSTTNSPLSIVTSSMNDDQLDKLLQNVILQMGTMQVEHPAWYDKFLASDAFSNFLLFVLTTFGCIAFTKVLSMMNLSKEQSVLWESVAAAVEKTYREYIKESKIGKLTPAQVKEAQDKAYIEAVAIAKEYGVDIDKKLKKEIVNSWITQIVEMRKRGIAHSLQKKG